MASASLPLGKFQPGLKGLLSSVIASMALGVILTESFVTRETFVIVTTTFHIITWATFVFIFQEMTLINDTIQLERFETVPFPLNFTVRLWNITNGDEVLAGGIPIMTEAGPYIYK